MLLLAPITFTEAAKFVATHHRHHAAPVGHKFSIAAIDEEVVRGVVIVGRPVARGLDDGWTLEVTRLCSDGAANACSMLYGAAWRAARAMGYRRMVTYTLNDERGTSLIAAGWKNTCVTKGGSWNRKSRPRVDKSDTQAKLRWEVSA